MHLLHYLWKGGEEEKGGSDTLHSSAVSAGGGRGIFPTSQEGGCADLAEEKKKKGQTIRSPCSTLHVKREGGEGGGAPIYQLPCEKSATLFTGKKKEKRRVNVPATSAGKKEARDLLQRQRGNRRFPTG